MAKGYSLEHQLGVRVRQMMIDCMISKVLLCPCNISLGLGFKLKAMLTI